MPVAIISSSSSSSCSKLCASVLHHSPAAALAAVWHGLSLTRLLSTGQGFSMSRLFTQQDVDAFVQLTGDSNPIHRSPGTAAAEVYPASPQTQQQQQQQPPSPAAESKALVPGMLLASMFPALIGSRFPGALYLTQTLKFRHSADVGARVHATVTVSKQSGSRVTFDTVCKDAQGRVLVDGTALALISSPSPAASPDTHAPSHPGESGS